MATGTMSLGDVQAFIQYSRQFAMPLAQIAGLMNSIQSGVASAERLFELLDAQEEDGHILAPRSIGRAVGGAKITERSHQLCHSLSLIRYSRGSHDSCFGWRKDC